MGSMHVLGISGSLRAASHNSALLRAAQELAPPGMEVEIYDGIGTLPHYDQDLEAEAPESVRTLRRKIRESDGLLIATPEYNYGPPGVLKNAIDWASRPAASSPLLHKPIALVSAAPTNFGGVRAQLALRQAFLWTDSDVVTKPELIVFRSQDRFDATGRLVDEATRALLVGVLEALAAKIVASRSLAA